LEVFVSIRKLICVVMAVAVFYYPMSLLAGEKIDTDAGGNGKSFLPSSPLFYFELDQLDKLRKDLGSLKLWKGGKAGDALMGEVHRLTSSLLGQTVKSKDAAVGGQLIDGVKKIHFAIYPPPNISPEFILVLECKDPAATLKGLGKQLAKSKYRGTEIVSIDLGMNLFLDYSAAAVVGKYLVISPRASMVRQALRVVAAGEGDVKASPGFADCASKFSKRPFWCYANTQVGLGISSDLEGDKEIQSVITALGLTSLRWAGFGISKSQDKGRLPFELMISYYKWSPAAALALPEDARLGAGLGSAVPQSAAIFASVALGDPVKLWTRMRPKLLRAMVAMVPSEIGDDEEADEAIKNFLEESNEVLGCNLVKDLLPLLSGDLGFFLLLKENDPIPVFVAGCKDQAAAEKLLKKLKIAGGLKGAIGGGNQGFGWATRIGDKILIADSDENLQLATKAIATGKTMAVSKSYKQEFAKLGKGSGVDLFISWTGMKQMIKGVRSGLDLDKLIAVDAANATRFSIGEKSFSIRSTGSLEGAVVLVLFSNLKLMAP
jgi:Protein of unknown function (DUF3352)